MEKEIITTVNLTASEGKTLVKAAKNESGNYVKNDERYIILSGTKVATPEADVPNWQEADSLEAFIAAEGFAKYQEENTESLIPNH